MTFGTHIRHLLALTLATTFSATAQAGQTAGPLAEETSLLHGASRISGARDWQVRQDGGNLTLAAPEGDAQLVLVQVQAASANAATTEAWRRVQPGFKLKKRLETKHPALNGWQQYTVTEYETSPNEHRYVEARAYRQGRTWAVLLVDGSEKTWSKRSAAYTLATESLQPKDYVRLSFAGKTPAPLDAQRQQALRAFLQDAMKKLKMPGLSYALLDRGQIVYEGGLGVREQGKNLPVDENTLFMAASNTKGMSTLLLSTLVDEGKLQWDQKVTAAFPAFRLGSPEVTSQVLIKHLVCACTGLPRQDMEWLFEYKSATPESTFEMLATSKPTSGFGEVCQYNNLMASAAGYIDGHLVHPGMALGKAYDTAMQQRIFAPLQMHSTTFDTAQAMRSNYASPHGTNLQGKVEVLPMDLNYAVLPHRPAGGVWTSEHDFIRYVQLEANQGKLLDGTQLVSAEALLARRAPQISEGKDSFYGMGLSAGTESGIKVPSHGGSLFGCKSNFYLLPDSGIGLVLLTNAEEGHGLQRPALRRLLELLYGGTPEAVDSIREESEVQAQQREAERMRTRNAAKAAASLSPHYQSAELGHLTVRREGKKVVFDFDEWQSIVGSRKNGDGSTSFVTTGAALSGLAFVVRGSGSSQELVVRDGQHEYAFKAARVPGQVSASADAPPRGRGKASSRLDQATHL